MFGNSFVYVRLHLMMGRVLHLTRNYPVYSGSLYLTPPSPIVCGMTVKN